MKRETEGSRREGTKHYPWVGVLIVLDSVCFSVQSIACKQAQSCCQDARVEVEDQNQQCDKHAPLQGLSGSPLGRNGPGVLLRGNGT